MTKGTQYPDFNLRHCVVETFEDLDQLRGSKYIKSDIGDTYIQAKDFLKKGRKVLFSGTPCQISGLKTFLRQPYENLLTIDLICHGVASPEVFHAYLKLREEEFGAKATKIEFRNKKLGWKIFSMTITFENNKQYTSKVTDDPFMRFFLKNLFLRPSCHNCQFSSIPRSADISLGDFWGVARVNSEWDDDKGTSLVLIQTNIGKDFLGQCRDELVIHSAKFSDAIKQNSGILESAVPHKKRTAFFKDFERLPYIKVEKKYLQKNLLDKLSENRRMIFKILTLLWMVLIFVFSSQPSTASLASSTGILKSIIDFIATIFGVSLSEAQRLDFIVQFSGVFRTVAHFTEFIILGFLVSKSFVLKRVGALQIILLMIIICFTYALSDELHQIFVPGRAFQIEDFAVDCSGSLVGIGITLICGFLKYRITKLPNTN